MKFAIHWILLFHFSILIQVHSQDLPTIKIYGEATQYAGMTLVLESYSNFISHEKTELAKIQVDAKGFFQTSIQLATTTYAFIDLGVFRAAAYLEPVKTYHLILPPYTPLKQADRFNPFFQPQEVVLGIQNSDAADLNQQIRDYDDLFFQQYNANAILLFNQNNEKLAAQIQTQLDSVFPPDKGSLSFKTHRFYREAKIKLLVKKRQKRHLIYSLFTSQPVGYSFPAYWDAFNELFKDFFPSYLSSSQGKPLKQAFTANATFDTLSTAMASDSLFKSDQLRELVLLKALYDAFYSGRTDEEAVIQRIAEATKTCSTNENREIATQLVNRITRLRVGTPAPNWIAITASGKEKELNDYKGKFVYLNFMNTQNFTCKKDLQTLTSISRDFKREVEVVTVLTDDDPESAFNYMKKNGYKWDIVHFSQQGKILMDYSIKIEPSYFIIDPEGNFIKSPAPGPEENFREILLDILMNYKRKNIRKQGDKQKSIYDI